MPRGWSTVGTAELIRDYLLERPASTKEVCDYVRGVVEGMGYVPPTYPSICRMMWLLRKLGLIEAVRVEAPERGGYIPKKIYRIVPGKENAPEWLDPQTAYYNPEKFKEKIENISFFQSPLLVKKREKQ